MLKSLKNYFQLAEKITIHTGLENTDFTLQGGWQGHVFAAPKLPLMLHVWRRSSQVLTEFVGESLCNNDGA